MTAIDTLTVPVDRALVERAAEAAYLATMSFRGPNIRFEPWSKLPEWWRRTYRAQAEAIIRMVTA